MTKVDIFSGFLGAGKTTLIKKLVKEAYCGEKLVIIENEFGDVGIDGGFLKESGIEIAEMNSGCICCSLVGDFSKALAQVKEEFNPDKIIIEPSGVGKLSDVIGAVEKASNGELFEINGLVAVVDAVRCKMYLKNFGEFFDNQISSAKCVILSHTDNASENKLQECIDIIRKKNHSASIITTPWDNLDGKKMLHEIEHSSTANENAQELIHEHHHHHHHDEHCDCGCHHEHEHHHHHEHGEHCNCGCHHEHEHEHHHHHEHGENCTCGCHHHDHEHHHHHADEVFESFGCETAKKYTHGEIENILKELDNEEKFGIILRAKGMVPSNEGDFIHFDYIPAEADIRKGASEPTGKICVIGSKINKDEIAKLFGLKN